MADEGTVPRQLVWIWWVLGVGMLALVWFGCLLPHPPNIPPPFPQFDKFEHLTAYLVLAAWFAAIYRTRRQRLTILVLLIVMGGAIEILQHFTGRDAEWLDWLADVVGTLLGLAWPARWLEGFYRYLTQRYAEQLS